METVARKKTCPPCYDRLMNQKKARIIRRFAKKFHLRDKAIKRTYKDLAPAQRRALISTLQSLCLHAPGV